MKRTNYFKGMSIALILTLALGCGSLAAFASGETGAADMLTDAAAV